MRRTARRLVIPGAWVLLAMAASAEPTIYRWLDERGQVQFSDRPPPDGAGVEEVAGPQAWSGRPESHAMPPPSPDKRTITPPMDEESFPASPDESTSPEDKARGCKRAQATLWQIENSARVRVKEDGGYRFLSPEEKAELRERALKSIEANCD